MPLHLHQSMAVVVVQIANNDRADSNSYHNHNEELPMKRITVASAAFFILFILTAAIEMADSSPTQPTGPEPTGGCSGPGCK